MKTFTMLAGAGALLMSSFGARDARAVERHFGFNYESPVLSRGLAELQPWTTSRLGRADYYNRLEARLGFQFGLTEHLQAALFWNASSTTEDIRLPGAALRSRLSSTDFQSLTAQFKYKLSDPVADSLGSALMLEGVAGPLLTGFELRLVLDKQLGSWLLVGNVFGGAAEQLELLPRSVGSFGGSLGAGYFLTPSVVAGLEARSENSFTGQFDYSVLYAGPTVSLVAARYWLTFAVQPQVAALSGRTAEHRLNLGQNEYVQTRLMLGFAL